MNVTLSKVPICLRDTFTITLLKLLTLLFLLYKNFFQEEKKIEGRNTARNIHEGITYVYRDLK